MIYSLWADIENNLAFFNKFCRDLHPIHLGTDQQLRCQVIVYGPLPNCPNQVRAMGT